ncbi:MAG: hypothetical protein HOL80_01370, partial [Candidatus Magasanikbacteria bacterium]|nr:hypothetical protein [Candidatus Magasanikbacteria bacterium]MBT5262532.1 hypothetical protein [Candidatus Magasanikbacteria bacterium]
MQQNTNEQLTNPFASLESDITKEALAQAKETFSQGVVRVKTSLSDKLSQLSSVGASLDSFITSLDSALETASNSEEEGVLTEAKEDLEKKAALIISVVGILEKININDVNIIEVLGEINTAAEVADEQTLSLTPEQQKVLINDILDKTAQELSISQKTLKKFKQTKLGLYHTDKHDQKHAVVQDFYAEVFKELEAGILNTYITFFTDNAEYSNEGENKKFIVNAFATEKFYQDNVEIVTAINNKDLEDQERSEAVEKLKTAIRNYTGETLIFLGEDAQDKEKSVLIGVDKQAYIQFLNGNTNVDTKNLGIGKTVLSPLLEAVKAAMVYRPAVVTNPSTEPNVNLDLASMFEGVDFDNLGEGQDSDDKSPSDNELENTSAPDIDVQTNTPQPNQPQPTQANQTQPTTDSVSLNPEQVQASTGTTPPVVDQVQPSTDQEGADQGPQPSQEQLAQQEAERHKTAMLEVYKLFFDRKTEKEIKENILRAGASHFTTIDLEDDKNKIVDDVYNTLCLMAEREKRRFVEQYIAEKFAQEEGKKGSLRKKAENLFSGNWKGVPNFLKPLLSGKTYGLMFAAGYVAEAGKKYISSSAGMSAILAGVYSLAEEGLISHNNKKITQYTNTAESALDVANFDMVSQDSTRDVQLATVFGTTKFYNDEFYPVTAHGIQLGAIKAAYDEEQDGEKRKKLILEHLRIVNEQELGDKFAEATTRYKTKKQGLASVRRYVRNFGTIYAISAFAGCGLFKRASIRFVTKGAIAGVETVLEGVKEKEVLTREEQLRKLLISGSIDDEVVREWLGKVDTKGVGFGDLAKRTGRTMLSQGLAAAGYGEAFNVGMQGAQGNFALASWYDGMGAVNEHAVGESEKTQQSQSRKQEANSEDKSNEGAQPKTTEPQPVAYKEARTVDGKPTTWNTEYASQYNVTHPTTEMVGEIDINGDGNKEAVTLMSETEARSGDGESRMLTRL